MADTGLDCAECEGARGIGQDPKEAAYLDGVAKGGAGSVHLETHNIRGRHTAVTEGGRDDSLLRGAVGSGERAGPAILVDCGSCERNAVSTTLAAAREHEDLAPLGADVAVGKSVKGLAAPVRGEHAGALEHHRVSARQDQIDAAHSSAVCVAHTHPPVSKMSGYQGRRAGGISADRRSFKIETIREPPRGDAKRA